MAQRWQLRDGSAAKNVKLFLTGPSARLWLFGLVWASVAGGVQIPLTNRDVRRARWVGYFLGEYLDPVFGVKN